MISANPDTSTLINFNDQQCRPLSKNNRLDIAFKTTSPDIDIRCAVPPSPSEYPFKEAPEWDTNLCRVSKPVSSLKKAYVAQITG